MSILIPNKVDFKTKNATKDKQEHFMIEGSTHEEDIAIKTHMYLTREVQNIWNRSDRIIIVEDLMTLF